MKTRMFGRRYAPDPRDTAYPLRTLLPLASARLYRYWNDFGWWGDQGRTPQCVAYAWTHWLEDGPVPQPGVPPVVKPVVLYHEAQAVDEWPGEDYDGTSVRAGAKALTARGFLSEYRWATRVAEITMALLEVGPVVVGTNWYEGMFTPGPGGILSVTGALAGGHAYVLNGVNVTRGQVRVKNSWGRAWGLQGRAWLPFADLARLMAEDGEACLGVERGLTRTPLGP